MDTALLAEMPSAPHTPSVSPLCPRAWLLGLVPLMLFRELALGSHCWLGSRCRGWEYLSVGVWMLSSLAPRANSKRQLMF